MGLREERMSDADVKIKRLTGELRDIYESYIMPVDLNIEFDQVILSQENRDKYMRLIKETEYAERLVEFGLKPTNRAILYGASGTGKTFSLKALANYLGYTMLYVDIGEALSSGEVSKHIKDIFRLADAISHCIIFFDECDSIAIARENNQGSDAGTMRRATNTIFQCLDQMSYKNIFVAASNLESALDAAFMRRFQIKMEFRKPDMDLKSSVMHFLYPKFTMIDDVDVRLETIINKRAAQNARLSYYEIEEIVYRVMKDAVLADSEEVHMQDVFLELAKSMNVRLKFMDTSDESEKQSKAMEL
jgi:SpoVK/Ycf46/Vps4 family AAA+-type ATPase